MNTNCLACLEGFGRHAIDCPERHAVHDSALSADFVRLNELLAIQHDNGPSFDLFNEATKIRRELAADTLAPEWLRSLACFVVEQLRCEPGFSLRADVLERRAADSGRDRRSRERASAERGEGELQLLCGAAVLAVLAVLFVLLWKLVVGGAVCYAAFRHLTRHQRRRRPRSSWAQLLQSGGVMLAAWNSRKLGTNIVRNGRPLRVSVPASADGPRVDDDGIPF